MSERKKDFGFYLPRRVECRQLKSGGYSFRLLKASGEWVPLGRNYEEALAKYEMIVNEVDIDFDETRVDPVEVWERHRKGAKQRGKEFNITVDDVKNLLQRQRGRCAVTGITFTNAKPTAARMRPWAASLDRIKSAEGYIPGNIRLVCGFVNVAMNDFGEEFLMSFIEKMVRRIMKEEMAKSLSDLGIRVPRTRRSSADSPIKKCGTGGSEAATNGHSI